jgi:peptide/nickel transport system substrate-binding protein
MKKETVISVIFVLMLCLSTTVLFAGGKTQAAGNANEITIATVADPKVLDPALGNDGESGMVLDRVFDGLVRYKPDGTIEPNIAERWETSPDGKKITFTIRRGIKFHDGTDVDAAAVKFSFDRQIAPNNTPEMPYAEEVWGKVSSCEAPDNYTVVLNLKIPDATFLVYLAQRTGIGSIISPTAFKADPIGFQRNPVGSGPYKFGEWIPDQYFTLIANEDYYEGKPKNDRLIYKIVKEPSVRASELLAGSVDALPSNISLQDIARLEADPNITVGSKPGINVGYMAFSDVQDPNRLFSDKRLREAVWRAIDRDALVRGLYGNNGVVAKSLIPPTMMAGDAAYQQPGYDPARAQALMAEAGYPNGFTFTLLSYNVTKGYNPAAERLAVALQNELSKVNIQVKVTIEPWAEYLTDAYSTHSPYDAVLCGWGAASNDTSYFMYLLRAGSIAGGDNVAAWNNPQFENLVSQATTNADPAAQREFYVQAAQLVNDEMPWLLLSHGTEYWAYRKNLQCEGLIGAWGVHEKDWVKK